MPVRLTIHSSLVSMPRLARSSLLTGCPGRKLPIPVMRENMLCDLQKRLLLRNAFADPCQDATARLFRSTPQRRPKLKTSAEP
jgi:hypothetical protein